MRISTRLFGVPGALKIVCAALSCCTVIPAFAAKTGDLDRMRSAFERNRSQASLVNDFISNTGSKQVEQVEIQDLQLGVRLLTPISSEFNHPGDMVRAMITAAPEGQAGKMLPAGTILEGFIDGAKSSARLSHDGSLNFRFYWAKVNGHRFSLTLAVDTADGALHPVKSSGWTRKERIRRMLIMTSALAIPAALGTGGISLAISAGAGAVIGGIMADDHQYFKGAVRGAWLGSGLGVFDPLVCKGKPMTLAWGTPLKLHLTAPAILEPHEAPHTETVASFLNYVPDKAVDDSTDLETSARIVNNDEAFIWTDSAANLSATVDEYRNPADRDGLGVVRRLIDENNLAAALQAANEACDSHPENPEIRAIRDALLDWVTGKRAYTKSVPK